MHVEFRDEILLRGGECETPENPRFLRKDKMVISVKIWNFSRSRMTKRTSPLDRLAKSSYHVKFRRIPRQSKFHVFRGTWRSVGHLALYEWLKKCHVSWIERGSNMGSSGAHE